MNADDEKRLQEYLDERLSESERSAFELRLEADGELQRKARAALELRKNLREDAAELPPGFYVRARERFEQTGPARGRRWFRLLSWESAGLAAAVALVAVLFVPPLMRDVSFRNDVVFAPAREMPGPSPKQAAADAPVAPAVETEPKSKPDAEREQLRESNISTALADVEGQERRLEVGDDANELRMREEVAQKAESRRAEEEWRETADEDELADARDDTAPLRSPAPSKIERQSGPVVAPLAPPVDLRQGAGRSAAAPKEKKRSAPEDFAQENEYERGRDAVEHDEAVDVGGAVAAGAKSPASPEASSIIPASEYSPDPSTLEQGAARILEARELPPGAVPPGAVQIVDTEEEWNELVSRSAIRALESVTFQQGSRIVLIGPRSIPFACSPITARVAGDRTEISLPHPETEGQSAVRGCVVYLPGSSPTGVVVRDPS